MRTQNYRFGIFLKSKFYGWQSSNNSGIICYCSSGFFLGNIEVTPKKFMKPILIYFMILTENCKFSKRNIIKINQWHIDSYYLMKTLFPSRSKESIESLLRAIVDDFWIGNVKKWWNKVTGRSKKVTSKAAYHQNRCGRYFVWYSPIRCMNRQRNLLLR